MNKAERRKPKRERATNRQILERIVVAGKLRLDTPAHFGNGDTDAFTDMPLIRDELDGSPLLTGASLAGALRNYLRERELGYQNHPPEPPADSSKEEKDRFELEQSRERNLMASLLFGAHRGDDDEGEQSPLIVYDAVGHKAGVELRDGVRIDPETHTAEDDKKFDFQLFAAGTEFDLRFELIIAVPDGHKAENQQAIEAHRNRLLKALATALTGLEKGEITLGARKRRGFGRCSVSHWTVTLYKMSKREDLLAWLVEGRGEPDTPWTAPVEANKDTSIAKALDKASGASIELSDDKRKHFILDAKFEIDGSLMVRSGFPDKGPDMIHLHSPRPDKGGGINLKPVLAGTSWAGALRSRATQIANTLDTSKNRNKAAALIDRMFGPAEIKTETKVAKSSRVDVAETVIAQECRLEQTRIKIDHFTGGAYESALFSESPLFGGRESQLDLRLSLLLPEQGKLSEQEAEIGLLLLLLKDLWTGDLPLGGELGIGRGRVKGIEADMTLDKRHWLIKSSEQGLVVEGDLEQMQGYVTALTKELSL